MTAEGLEVLIRSNEWLMHVLTTVRAARLSDAWVGAGAVRDLVWGECFGSGFVPGDEAIGTWPETATAVAVRLAAERIEVCAPFGLDDLLNGVWRRNPARVSPEQSAARLARHRPGHRWPGVTVIPPG